MSLGASENVNETMLHHTVHMTSTAYTK